MRRYGRRASAPAVFAVLLVVSTVGTALAQDRYEELLDELPEVELGSECTAEEEGDLAAVPGTIVICAATADDPDRFSWREASGEEVDAALERIDDDTDGTDEPTEEDADEPAEVEAPARIDAGDGGLAARSPLTSWLPVGLALVLLAGLLAARTALRSEDL
jgi:hypothetical protein